MLTTSKQRNGNILLETLERRIFFRVQKSFVVANQRQTRRTGFRHPDENILHMHLSEKIGRTYVVLEKAFVILIYKDTHENFLELLSGVATPSWIISEHRFNVRCNFDYQQHQLHQQLRQDFSSLCRCCVRTKFIGKNEFLIASFQTFYRSIKPIQIFLCLYIQTVYNRTVSG
jgi:hypothetical protein